MNQIDKHTKGGNSIEVFQHFHYHTVEDEKYSQKLLSILTKLFHIYKLNFIPSSHKNKQISISCFLKEIFIYLGKINKATSESFSDCLGKRVECIITQINIDADKIVCGLYNIKKLVKSLLGKVLMILII